MPQTQMTPEEALAAFNQQPVPATQPTTTPTGEQMTAEQALASFGPSRGDASQWGPWSALDTGLTLGLYPRFKAAAMTGGLESMFLPTPESRAALANIQASRAEYNKEHPWLGPGLEIGGSIAPGAAAAALVPEIAGPAALGRLAPLAGQIMTAGARGAASGLAQVPMTEGPLSVTGAAEDVGFGALTGGALPIAGQALRMAVPVAEGIRTMAQGASEAGFDLRPGQVTSSALMRWIDNWAAGGRNSQQLRDLTRYVSWTVGADTDSFGAQELEDAYEAAQARLDAVAAKTKLNLGSIRDPSSWEGKVADLKSEMTGMSAASKKLVQRAINNVRAAADRGGNVSGEAYQRLTRWGGVLGELSGSGDSNVREMGGRLREALDDSLAAGSAPEDVADLREARGYIRNANALERIIEKGSPSGVIDPGKLKALVASGDLGVLANVAKFLPRAAVTGEAMPAPGHWPGWAKGLAVLNLGVAAAEAQPLLHLAESHPLRAGGLAALGAGWWAGRRVAGAMAGSDALRDIVIGEGWNPSPLTIAGTNMAARQLLLSQPDFSSTVGQLTAR